MMLLTSGLQDLDSVRSGEIKEKEQALKDREIPARVVTCFIVFNFLQKQFEPQKAIQLWYEHVRAVHTSVAAQLCLPP